MNNKHAPLISQVTVTLRGSEHSATGTSLAEAIRSLGLKLGYNHAGCNRLRTSIASGLTVIDRQRKRGTATLYQEWSEKRQRKFQGSSAWPGDVIGTVVIDFTYEDGSQTPEPYPT